MAVKPFAVVMLLVACDAKSDRATTIEMRTGSDDRETRTETVVPSPPIQHPTFVATPDVVDAAPAARVPASREQCDRVAIHLARLLVKQQQGIEYMSDVKPSPDAHWNRLARRLTSEQRKRCVTYAWSVAAVDCLISKRHYDDEAYDCQLEHGYSAMRGYGDTDPADYEDDE
jgi:hypothetical protein